MPGPGAGPGPTPRSGPTPPSGAAPAGLAWAAFAVAGAGLVDAALAAERWATSPGWSATLLALALGELGWALTALARGRTPGPRTSVAVLLVTGAGWPLAVVQRLVPAGAATGSGSVSPLTAADAAATALHLLGAAAVALLVRRAEHTPAASGSEGRSPRPTRPGTGAAALRTVAGWSVAALVTAALVTPGLAATRAGAFAQPHGTHGAAPSGAAHDAQPTARRATGVTAGGHAGSTAGERAGQLGVAHAGH